MSTLTSFELFPNLPSEIRLKIWGIILSTPRVTTLKCNKEPYKPGKPRAAKSFTSDCPPPALLHVNRETRYEALNVYTPHFKHPLSPHYTYLNLSLDTLKLADGVLHYLAKVLPVDLNMIQRMALDTKDCSYFGHFNMEILKSMSGLRELEIVGRKATVEIPWGPGPVGLIEKGFLETKKEDPGWECPTVRIFNGESGELGRVVQGGALIPGWTAA